MCGRKPPCEGGSTGRGIDTQDLVELRGGRAAAEEVDRAAECDRGGVVPRRGKRSDRVCARGCREENAVGRRVCRRQPAEQHDAVRTERRCRRILQRRRQRPRRAFDQVHRGAGRGPWRVPDVRALDWSR